jgi:DNA modification methylase
VGDRKQTEVWEIDRPHVSDLHPTMKPVPLIQRALRNSSMPGDVVLDLFGGSGSTLIACETMKRRCYMLELDPAYCDVIVERWEKLTGRKAERSQE